MFLVYKSNNVHKANVYVNIAPSNAAVITAVVIISMGCTIIINTILTILNANNTIHTTIAK